MLPTRRGKNYIRTPETLYVLKTTLDTESWVNGIFVIPIMSTETLMRSSHLKVDI